jgi:hypothetical protein
MIAGYVLIQLIKMDIVPDMRLFYPVYFDAWRFEHTRQKLSSSGAET